MNLQAFYVHGGVEAELTFLDRCDYASIYRQAAKDWYHNQRVWRPVTEDDCDCALNAVPPITMRRGFIAGEPYCHTHVVYVMGNSIKIAKKHYVREVTKEWNDKFWSLKPTA
jgi:hypothetical protein